MKKFFKKRKGFTLIELLVVVAVIGLLVSAVTVFLTGQREKARDAKAETEIKQILSAFELKYTGDGQYPDLPSGLGNIPANDPRLSPYLDPVPHTNGKRAYQWYNGGDRQKFCVLFQHEVDPTNYFTCSHIGCYVKENSPECPNFDS